MSKPSEKAMSHIDWCAAELAEQEGNTEISYYEIIEPFFIKHTAEALEAQHRKTWALAMTSVTARYNDGGGGDWSLDQAFMQELKTQFPCPPIEATKDK